MFILSVPLGIVAFNFSHSYSKLSPFAPHDKDVLKLFTLKVMVFDNGCTVTLGMFTMIKEDTNKYLRYMTRFAKGVLYMQL